MPKKLTTEEFIAKARAAHGPDAYDYSQTVYVHDRAKVKIICKRHGIFEQIAGSHTQGRGCQKCGVESRTRKRSLGLESFILKSKEVHKGKGFDYSRTVYVNSSTKVEIICPTHGIFWVAPNDHLFRKSGCPECGLLKAKQASRKSVDDYINFSRDGIKWVGEELPLNRKTKTSWQCPEGHIWQSSYNNVVRGGASCPKCPFKLRKTKQDYLDAHDITGIKWVGDTLPKDVNTKTKWQCPLGHIWTASYGQIVYSRSGCSHCPKPSTKTIEDYHRIRGKGGAHWIGTELPRNVTYHTEWQCNQGHVWRTSYKAIVLQGSGCQICYGPDVKTPGDYHQLALSRDFHWIGPEVSNTRTPTGWECKYGHQWKAAYSNVQGGTGCPTCNESKGEKRIAAFLNLLRIPYTRQKSFSGCRGKRNPLRFDFYIFIHNQGILIEFDGAFHFAVPEKWGGQDALEDTQRTDAIKTQFAKDNDLVMIRIPYTEYDRIEMILTDEIEKHTGQPIASIGQEQRRKTKAPLFNPTRYKQVPLL
jgi:hypothetical protein